MKYLVYARYKYIYQNGAIILKDLAEPTVKKDDNVFTVHEQFAPPNLEPIGGIESEGEPILSGYADTALTLLQASEIIAAVEADEAEAI